MLSCQVERRKIMNYKFKTKPYAHQMTALEKSWNRETYAYFMEMGTGKTKVLIDNLAMLYDKGKINGALIIACLLYTSPSPRDGLLSRMPSSA